jgi:hypothetical protein
MTLNPYLSLFTKLLNRKQNHAFLKKFLIFFTKSFKIKYIFLPSQIIRNETIFVVLNYKDKSTYGGAL